MNSLPWLPYLLAFARCSSFITFLPPVQGRGIPIQTKVALAMALTCATVPVAQSHLTAQPPPDFHWWLLAWLCAAECVFGLVLAWLWGSVLLLAKSVGSLAAEALGLELAGVTSVLGTDSSQSLSQLFEILCGMLLLACNAHHIALASLHHSFALVPLAAGAPILPEPGLIQWGLLLANAPIWISLPLLSVTGSLVILIAGMMRQVPQFNLLSIGMPFRVLAGLFALYWLLPLLLGQIYALIRQVPAQMEHLLQT